MPVLETSQTSERICTFKLANARAIKLLSTSCQL
jgi:hypothetical protein